jgi:hypothetical protein
MRVPLKLVVLPTFLLASGCSYLGSPFESPEPVAAAPNFRSVTPTKKTQVSHSISQSRAVRQLPPPPLEVNAEVRKEMSLLLKGNGRYLRECLDRRDKYYPLMAQIFEDEGIPHDLLSLALVESGYNVHARSNMGAVGMWQFMKSTARLYGLSVTFFEDQRKDPILSTIAAARHLKDLYRLYKDWYLALAAYNAGPGAVQHAIQRGGASGDFWSLARKGRFAKQTRSFVPRFIAAALIVRSPESFGVGAGVNSGQLMASLGDFSGKAEDESQKVRAIESARGAKGPTKAIRITSPAGTPGRARGGHTPVSYRTAVRTGGDLYTP